MNKPQAAVLPLMGATPAKAPDRANPQNQSAPSVGDSWITTKVNAEMTADKEVSAHNVNVNTDHGVVTLTGTAATDHESEEAADIARHTNGVVSVTNDIHVQTGDKAGA